MNVSENSTDRVAGIGPQCASDSAFTARMRFHQSWYRATELRLPHGVGPQENRKSHYGNMLTKADGERDANFLSKEIFEVVKRRLDESKGAVEPFRLWNNMLSSQPMCFNLFGPLVADLDLATRAFRKIIPGKIKRVTKVAIEYAPEPASEYLDDRTAFDAFVEFTRPDGSMGFVGIETKLTEPFSPEEYDRPAYRRWVERKDSPWPRESWGQLAYTKHNQLWRDHLLAVAMQHRPGSPYGSGYCMLVHHPANKGCSGVVAAYKRLLKTDEPSFLDCPLNTLVEFLAASAETSKCQSWLATFERRYLDFSLSAEAWQRETGR